MMTDWSIFRSTNDTLPVFSKDSWLAQCRCCITHLEDSDDVIRYRGKGQSECRSSWAAVLSLGANIITTVTDNCCDSMLDIGVMIKRTSF